MRIERLNVNGFGQLHGLQVELKENVTVLYGPNGAGKSTLLGFVRAMLFGIPARNYGPQRYEPLDGGVHGGSLTARDEEDRLWFIERYARPPEGSNLSGTAGDRLRISRSDDGGGLVELAQEDLRKELLGGMSKEMFHQLFAVTLSELQEVSALASDDLSRYLFHAGIGGGSSVLQAEKKLAQEMDKLFRPRGRSQEIARLVQEHELLEHQAGAAKALLPRYQEVTLELKELESLLSTSAAVYAQCTEEEAKLRKAVAVRSVWLRRDALRRELTDLPERVTFPAQARERWYRLQEDKANAVPEVNELKRKIDALNSEMQAILPDSAFLEKEQGLLQLEKRLPGYESRLREAAELASEASQLSQKVRRCLESIHPDWGNEQLREFAGTIGDRETVRRMNADFNAYEKEMELLHHERLKLERETASARMELGRASERLALSVEEGKRDYVLLIPKDRHEIRSLWNEVTMLIDRMRGEEVLLREGSYSTVTSEESIKHPHGNLPWMLGGALALTVMLPLLLWLTTKSIWGTALSGVILLGIDMYLGRQAVQAAGQARKARRKVQGMSSRGHARGTLGRPSPHVQGQQGNTNLNISAGIPMSATPAGLRLSELLPRLTAHPLTDLSLTAEFNSYGIPRNAAGRTDRTFGDEEERNLRRLMEKWQLWIHKQETLEEQAADLRRRADELAEALTGLERELTRKEEIFTARLQAWERWLMERQLPPELSPEAALEVFRLAEQGRERLEQLDAVSVKLELVQRELASFESDCRMLIGIGGLAEEEVAATLESHIPGQLHRALAELEHQQRLREAASRSMEKKGPLEEELGRALDRLKMLEEAEEHLLRESGAADGEQFLRIAEEQQLRDQLKEELRQAELEITVAIGSEAAEELEQLLESTEEQELMVLLQETQGRLEEAEIARQSLVERRGRLLQERESLEAQGLQDHWQQQLAEQEAALNEAVDRYAAMALCQELISRVRKVYEQERQPQVIKTASSYLEEMTEGLYTRILVKMGTQELMVEHRDHGPIGSSYLSRGTAEQTYLAMRLALSDAVSGITRLPLLLDDLFVNFDAARLRGALSVLNRVSEKQQIIFMTCHRHVLEGIREQFPAAGVIEMS